VPERVIVAMSGGVDSSVAAARLVDQGFDVIGVTLHLWDQPPGGGRGRCCAPEDVHDARRVADKLGIAHYAFDRRETFLRRIVEPFVEDYLHGRTPSPCTVCNQQIKIPTLLRIASALGARGVATGHYARIRRTAEGWPRLLRGLDPRKDQSYYLYALGPEILDRLLLPLGESTKPQVRADAVARALPGAGKGESQDLCFVAGSSYHEVVERFAPDRIRPGTIVDENGAVLSSHPGVHRFTLGQRKGLGLGGAVRFVKAIDADTGRVVVGDENALWAWRLEVERPTIAAGIQLPIRARVQVRYRHEPQAALLEADGSSLVIRFEQPVRAASCGQAAVAWVEDAVVAGGIITGTDAGAGAPD